MSSAAKRTYDYTVTVDANSAAGKVVQFAGTGKKILEIGAGPGSITRALMAAGNPDMTALEVMPDSVAILKTFVPHVVGADLNAPNWPSAFGTTRFDVIIAADVLEHLLQPLETLRAMQTLLAPGGKIILSLPHVGHAALLASLCANDFDYREAGLLDKTHLRFFGINNMQQLVADAGLCITDAAFIQRPPEKTEFAEAWGGTPAPVQAALLRNPFATVYQVVMSLQTNGNNLQLMQMPVADCRLSLPRRLSARFRRWRRSKKK